MSKYPVCAIVDGIGSVSATRSTRLHGGSIVDPGSNGSTDVGTVVRLGLAADWSLMLVASIAGAAS